MKIIPNIYVTLNDKDGKRVSHPSGVEVDLPKPVAEDLLERGFATLPSDETAAPAATGPSVVSESGPQIKPAA